MDRLASGGREPEYLYQCLAIRLGHLPGGTYRWSALPDRVDAAPGNGVHKRFTAHAGALAERHGVSRHALRERDQWNHLRLAADGNGHQYSHGGSIDAGSSRNGG